MAYDQTEIEQLSIEAINENDLVFIDEIIPYIPCSRATFYNLGLDKLDTIKEALESKRIKIKSKLRKKWYDSDNATVQIALYKLIGTDEESDRINSQKIKSDQNIKHELPITEEEKAKIIDNL